jgi:hypothetical protein
VSLSNDCIYEMTTLVQRSLRTSPRLYAFQPTSILLHSLRINASPLQTSLLAQKRHDSTATAIATQPTLHRSKVNGPLSTLPPPLTVPERKPDQSLPSYLFSLGKSYVTFYKSGGKAIYSNFKSSRPIQKTLDNNYDGSLKKAVDAGFLDRDKFQLLTRSWYDTKRVPIFALVFAVCGEFTPLVVVFLTNAVPYTCRIPKQVEAYRTKLEKRRAISFRNLTTVIPESGVEVEKLERMQLLHISWSLGLSSSAWDWLGGRLPGLPTPLLRRKVTRRVNYLRMDDTLIKRGGGVDEMDAEEVKIALVERGVDILGRNEEQMRTSLKAWLRARDLLPVEELLLKR